MDGFSRRGVFLVVIGALCGCSGAQRSVRRSGPATARDYFPLRTGAAWSFDAETGEESDLGSTVLAVLAVVRVDGDNILVRSGTRTERWALLPDGVTREGDYVIRDPLRVGNTWSATSGGRLEIRGVGEIRTVTAGSFHNVVEVVRTSPDQLITTTTWYAPDVGAVEILAVTRSSLGTEIRVRSSLRGYTLGSTGTD